MTAEICRVCETNENLKNIFDMNNKHILKKLRVCANVKLDENDALPKNICLACDEKLGFVYEFKILCEYTDNKLRNAITQIQPKEIIIDVIYENYNSDEVFLKSNEKEEYLLDEYSVDALIKEDKYKTKFNTSLDFIGNDPPLNLYIDPVDQSKNTGENDYPSALSDEESYEYIKTEVLEKLDDELSSIHEDAKTSNSVTKDILLSKKLKSSSEKYFECDTCKEVFSNYFQFNNHKKMHGKQRYQCPICIKWFSKRYRLKNHMAIHEIPKLFYCTMCDNKYTNQGNLDRHIRHFHKQERPYMCTECGLSFSRSNILKQHYAVHTNERKFVCEICSKRFKTESYLKVHQKSHIPGEFRRIRPQNPAKVVPIRICICPYCGKKSNNSRLHQSHIRTHTGEKPYECNTCNKKFAFQQSLKTHVLLHTGEKPYECDICKVSFRQIGHLKGHKLTHSGVKQHKCQYCEKTFALRGNLNVHQRLHTGETPYNCNMCSKKFYDSNGLKRHKLSHLKNRTHSSDSKNNFELGSMKVLYDGVGNEYIERIEMHAKSETKLTNVCDTNQNL